MPCLQKHQGPDLLGLCTQSNFSLQHNIDVRWQPRWDSLILYITAPFLYQANSIYVNIILAAARVENSVPGFHMHSMTQMALQSSTVPQMYSSSLYYRMRIFLWQGVISFSRITTQMFSCSHISPSIKTPELTSLWNLSLTHFLFPCFKITFVRNEKKLFFVPETWTSNFNPHLPGKKISYS